MKPTKDYIRNQEIVNSVLANINDDDKNNVYIQFQTKEKPVDNNFEITHRDFVVRSFRAGGDPYGQVKAYIIEKTRLDCGLYFGSIAKTSEMVGVSKSTVARVFSSWQEADIIRNYMDSVWAVHPKLLRKGKGGKYIGLLRFYYSLPKKERHEEVISKDVEMELSKK